MAAVNVIDEYIESLPGTIRRLGHAEWGITVAAESAAGYTLDVGVRIADGLVRAQAFALPAQPGLDPWLLLHWNRQTRFVRIAAASPIHSSNRNSMSNRSNQRACPLASMPTRTVTARLLSSR